LPRHGHEERLEEKHEPVGNREILFDQEGREAAAGTPPGEFRRPSWLKAV
jgi:hypothetical protein